MAKTLWVQTPDTPGGNYQQGVAELMAAGILANLGPGAFRLTVVHADDCGIFRGKPCNCKPEFELSTEVA